MMQRTEVVYVMAHLAITVCIIALYGVTVIMDRPDTTLQNLLLIAGGYWFGVAGGTQIKDALAKRKNPVHKVELVEGEKEGE